MDQSQERKFLTHELKDLNASSVVRSRGITAEYFQWSTAGKLHSINLWYTENYSALLTATELAGLLKQSTTIPEDLQQSITVLFNELQLEPLDTDINFLCDSLTQYHKQSLVERALRTSVEILADKKTDLAIETLKNSLNRIESKFRTEIARSGQLDEFGDRIFAEYEDRKINPSKYEGLKFGIDSIDKYTGGLVNSSVSILLAPPKEFKTAFAMTFCYNVAKRGVYSLYFANEGTIELFYMRFAAMELSIPLSHIKDGTMTDMEESRWIQFITSVR